jgi:hypothetical protein
MASLLSTASRLNTANQLTDWNTSCIQAMNQAKSTFSSIATQRVAMETNSDYTPEDIAEVDAMLLALNGIAKTLIAPTIV